jgi:hypothetical protein
MKSKGEIENHINSLQDKIDLLSSEEFKLLNIMNGEEIEKVISSFKTMILTLKLVLRG